MSELDGEWLVERVGGALPPMVGVEKRIAGATGETVVGNAVRLRFDVRGLELHYRFPFTGLVDHLEPADGGFAGRATLGGREVGRFRLRRRGDDATSHPLDAELRRLLDEAIAMEAGVLRSLDSMIRATDDPEIVELLRAHRLETERHEERLRSRLAARGASPSLVRGAGAVVGGLMKEVLDAARGGRGARDAYATEHFEIAAYELLERIATRAGDEETARVARENREEERAMARRLDERWDRLADLSVS